MSCEIFGFCATVQRTKTSSLSARAARVSGCVLGELARRISESLAIPTIGIGAGVHCDGQVQVLTDVLGLLDFTPRHARHFTEAGAAIKEALAAYAAEVRAKTFPTDENTF